MLLPRLNNSAIRTIISQTFRSFSLPTSQAVPQLARTKDGSTIVAWHKPVDFPYECTKPLPKAVETTTETVLKTQMSSELMNIFNKKTPEQARIELMNLTHTTKHRWFPRPRDKRAKKTPMDRQYL